MSLAVVTQITQLSIVISTFLLVITIHEYAHAYTAYLLGDDTAYKAGRLTLNPLAHIEPVGFILLVLVHFGWAKPVPMDSRNFAYPRLFSIIAALAGPFSNLVCALVLLYMQTYIPMAGVGQMFFDFAIRLNVMLALFNLIPIPPLDGSHILEALVPEQFKPAYYTFARYALFILLFLFMLPITKQLMTSSIATTTLLLKKLVIGKP